MNVQNFGIMRVPILGLAVGNLRTKCHLDVAPRESQKIYYKEGSGASSQRLWVM